MSSLGRLANSLFSLTNENTVALANLNFDFTLFKFEAPKEFRSIGNNLSLRRRDDAEEGKHHKTARKLAALFESLVPPTPSLLKAYGTRASEIACHPGANPKGSKEHGPFADFVGIDGTTLWAAATSGQAGLATHAALAMHLLACMLARAWDDKKATSIWVEMVTERQNEIANSIDDAPQYLSACMAARQDITREELAKWDGSARSWLQSADEVKKVAKTKLMLIIKNIHVNISAGENTYQNVINAWRHALLGMENLIQGKPQEASDGSVLLALSSWHIYPDLMVIGSPTKSEKFHDPLVRPGGIITVGLQDASATRDMGMHWSLTLSQYRFYERDIRVDSGDETGRIPIDELLVVAMGSLFSAWRVPKAEELPTARWLVALNRFIDSSPNKTHLAHRSWLNVLGNAGQRLMDINNDDLAHCSELVAWGRRRAKDFLGFQSTLPEPFFGLLSPALSRAFSRPPGIDGRIVYLRSVAQALNFPGTQYVIRCQERRGDLTYYEFATALPHRTASHKRSLDGSTKWEDTHKRWFLTETRVQPECSCICSCCQKSCNCVPAEIECHEKCHPGELEACEVCDNTATRRRLEVLAQGEQCFRVTCEDVVQFDPLLHKKEDSSDDVSWFVWRDPPSIFCQRSRPETYPIRSYSSISVSQQGNKHVSSSHERNSDFCYAATFRCVYGDAQTVALFVQVQKDHQSRTIGNVETSKIEGAAERASESRIDIEDAVAVLVERRLNSESLITYLDDYVSEVRQAPPTSPHLQSLFEYHNAYGKATRHWESRPPPVGTFGLHQSHFKALTALAVAEDTFVSFREATIPLRITSISLSAVKWFDEVATKIDSIHLNADALAGVHRVYSVRHMEPSRCRSFACIVTLESGQQMGPSDCQGIIAVSVGNSIFVAAELLSDPLDFGACGGQVRRLTGNVGMPGISLMILPQSPLRIRPMSHDLRVVPHLEYDHKRQDNFQGTSLHLSFTNWRRPFDAADHGMIDETIFWVECVVSVHDRGKWVADVDILALENRGYIEPWPLACECGGSGDGNMTSIDSWEEILDLPENVGVVRAHGNWAARLAVLAVCRQRKDPSEVFVVRPKDTLCARCLPAQYCVLTGHSTGLVLD